jgi:hypothetical protein
MIAFNILVYFVSVAIVDIESGTWKMAREMFGVLQGEMLLQKKKINEINIQSIQQVATDIRKLVEVTSNIRGKTAKFQREIVETRFCISINRKNDSILTICESSLYLIVTYSLIVHLCLSHILL